MVLNQMLSAEADERARIAEELHDDTVQVLTATLLSLDRQRLSGDRGSYEASAEAGQRARATLALALERPAPADVRAAPTAARGARSPQGLRTGAGTSRS